MITLRQWEIFAAVVAHGSFRRCAEALGISQVSVSEHMRSLEKHLGVELFERTPGGPVHLTEAGKRAVTGVEDLLAHAHDFVEMVAGGEAEDLVIEVALHGFMMRNLRDVVEIWNSTATKEIQLRSHDSTSEELLQQVMARELHTAYFYSFGGLDAVGEIVGFEPLSLFVSSDHPLVTKPVVTIADLEKVPVVGLSTNRPLRRVSDAILHSLGIESIVHAVETSEFGLILSSLRRGIGYTCMFRGIREEEAQNFGLSVLNLDRDVPPLEIRRITRRAARRDNALRSALTTLEQVICQPTEPASPP